MQHLLRAHGADLAGDGAFGVATDAAVRTFQRVHGLPEHGRVEAITWPQLVIEAGPGSTGEAVVAVQSFGLLVIPGDEPLAMDGRVRARD